MKGISPRNIMLNFQAITKANIMQARPLPINAIKSENLNEITPRRVSTLLYNQENKKLLN